jgi:hypothetical protein
MTYVGNYLVEKKENFLMAVSGVEIIVRWWWVNENFVGLFVLRFGGGWKDCQEVTSETWALMGEKISHFILKKYGVAVH